MCFSRKRKTENEKGAQASETQTTRSHFTIRATLDVRDQFCDWNSQYAKLFRKLMPVSRMDCPWGMLGREGSHTLSSIPNCPFPISMFTKEEMYSYRMKNKT